MFYKEKSGGRDFVISKEEELGQTLEYWRQIRQGHFKLYDNLKSSAQYYDKLTNGNGDEITEQEEQEMLTDGVKEWKDEILKTLKDWRQELKSVYRFLAQSDKAEYLDHDLANEATKVMSGLELSCILLESEKVNLPGIFRKIKIFIEAWERYWVAMEDVLLRKMSDKEVLKECVGELDIDLISRMIDYFKNIELSKIRQEAGRPKSKYLDSDKKNFIVECDFSEIKKELEGKKVLANDGLINNFILNGLRNAVKVNTESSNFIFNMVVEGGELVIRLMDDGKGVDSDSLNPESKACIFNSGSSKTKSTGLGMAYAHDRITSLGAEFNVVSYRKSEEKNNTYPFGVNWDLDEFNKKRWHEGKKPVNTIFEIRLPITKKK